MFSPHCLFDDSILRILGLSKKHTRSPVNGIFSPVFAAACKVAFFAGPYMCLEGGLRQDKATSIQKWVSKWNNREQKTWVIVMKQPSILLCLPEVRCCRTAGLSAWAKPPFLAAASSGSSCETLRGSQASRRVLRVHPGASARTDVPATPFRRGVLIWCQNHLQPSPRGQTQRMSILERDYHLQTVILFTLFSVPSDRKSSNSCSFNLQLLLETWLNVP